MDTESCYRMSYRRKDVFSFSYQLEVWLISILCLLFLQCIEMYCITHYKKLILHTTICSYPVRIIISRGLKGQKITSFSNLSRRQAENYKKGGYFIFKHHMNCHKFHNYSHACSFLKYRKKISLAQNHVNKQGTPSINKQCSLHNCFISFQRAPM